MNASGRRAVHHLEDIVVGDVEECALTIRSIGSDAR